MATVTDERERIELIMSHAPGVVGLIDRYKDDNDTIKPSELPGVIVYRAGRGEHSGDSTGDYFSSRLWLAWVVVQEIVNMNRQSKRDADDAAEALLDPIIKYLRQHRRLEYEGQPDLGGIQGITVRDDGVKEDQVAGKRYSVLPILIYVGKITQTWSEE